MLAGKFGAKSPSCIRQAAGSRLLRLDALAMLRSPRDQLQLPRQRRSGLCTRGPCADWLTPHMQLDAGCGSCCRRPVRCCPSDSCASLAGSLRVPRWSWFPSRCRSSLSRGTMRPPPPRVYVSVPRASPQQLLGKLAGIVEQRKMDVIVFACPPDRASAPARAPVLPTSFNITPPSSRSLF